MTRSLLVLIAIVLAAALNLNPAAVAASQPQYENNLREHLATVDQSAMVPVFVRIGNPYPVDELVQEVQGMTLPQRRQHAMETLQDHFQSQAGQTAQWLEQEVYAGSATDLHSLWIAHGFLVKVRADRVEKLAELDEVIGVRYDPPIPFEQVNDEIIVSEKPGQSVAELDEVSWAVEYIGADQLWDLGYHGENVLVAIIDSGVLLEHPDLVDHVWVNIDEYPDNNHDDDLNGYIDDIHGWNFYDNNADISDIQGHGTKCTGIVAGDGTGGTETGIAPEATWMMIRNYNNGWSSEATRAAAVQYAVTNGASVISCSMSYDRIEPNNIPDYVTHRYTYTALLATGVISVNSTGNNNPGPIPWNINAPGNSPAPFLHPEQTLVGGITGVMAIGAHGDDGWVEGFTGNGPAAWEELDWPLVFQDYPYADGAEMGLLKPDILAPSGVPTLSHFGGYYGSFTGTSAASPVVGGALTLLRGIHPQAPPEALAEALMMTAEDGGDPGFDNTWGTGLMKVNLAHDYLDNMYDYGSLQVIIETAGPIPDSVTVIVGDGEIINKVYGQDEVMLERVLPGIYDVAVDLPGNDRRYFSGFGIEAGIMQLLIISVDNDQFTVTPDDIELIAHQPQDMFLEFEVTNPDPEPFTLNLEPTPPGGVDWIADVEVDFQADSIHAITANTYGFLLAGHTSGTPVFLIYDQYTGGLLTYPQPGRFGDEGCEAITTAYPSPNDLAMLYDRKIYTTDRGDWFPEPEVADSLELPEEIVEPAGLACFYLHSTDISYFIGDNVSRMLYRLDALDGSIRETYNLNGMIVRSLASLYTYSAGFDGIKILAEDPVGDRYLAVLNLETGQIETQPILRPLVGFNPRAMDYASLVVDFNFGTVVADSTGLVRKYYQRLDQSLVESWSPSEIPQGSITVNVQIDPWILPPYSQTHFDMVFRNLETGFRDTSSVMVEKNYSSIEEVDIDPLLPSSAALTNIYPNPFNASVTIEYALPSPSQVKLVIYDVLGRQVVKLDDAYRVAGQHTITWTPANIASGLYFAVFESNDIRSTRKLLLMK